MFIPLHVRSHFSLGVGTASVETLVADAAQAGFPALGLADLENLYGQVRFHAACRRRGVRAITGVELRPGFEGGAAGGNRAGRLILLARNALGYANLCRIVSSRRIRAGTSSPKATGEDPVRSLEGQSEGLFILTDDGAAARRVLDLPDVERSDVRLLLVRPGNHAGAADTVLHLSEELGVRIAADVDAVMPRREDHALHVLLTAIRHETTLRAVRQRGLAEPPERYLGEPARIHELFADRPDAVAETVRIAEACTLTVEDMRAAPPANADESRRSAMRLYEHCRAVLAERRAAGLRDDERYELRLADEVAVIESLGHASWVQMVGEIAADARSRGILTAGRGSAASSLVMFLLGITQVDPIEHGLIFERFLNAQRRDAPDIDVDVDSTRRDELIARVHRRWGRDRVARVSTMQTFRLRSAIRATLRAGGMAPAAVNRLLELLPQEENALARAEDRLESLLLPHLRPLVPLIGRLSGTPHHLSVHPGGLVIVPDAIESRVPLERAPGGAVVTQYDVRSVGEAGLLKIDLLGNRALAQIAGALLLRAPNARPRIAHPSDIPLDDPATLERLDRADTIGCFQVESPAVRSVLRRMPVRRFDDVIAALAVVRPGAAAGTSKRMFLERARGEDDDGDPAIGLPEIGTHGVLLFEEDIMQLLQEAGGVSLTEADALRADIIRHGDDAKTLAAMGERFVAGAADATAARAAWQAATRFAAYSFSRAHAASYALIAMQVTWLRTHAATELGCALLHLYGGMYPLRTIAAALARDGVVLLGPSVNASGAAPTVERGPAGAAVRIGLGAIRRVRRGTIAALLAARAERRFRDVPDLLRRMRLQPRELEALVLTGAFDMLPPLTPEAYPFVHDALIAVLAREANPDMLAERLRRVTRRPAQGTDAERLDRYRRLVRVRNEIQFLDVHVSDHPMRLLRRDAAAMGCTPTHELIAHADHTVRVAGILAASRRVETRAGTTMKFLTLEDEHGTVEIVLLPPALLRVAERITTPGPYLVTGRVRVEQDDVSITASDVSAFHERGGPGAA